MNEFNLKLMTVYISACQLLLQDTNEKINTFAAQN